MKIAALFLLVILVSFLNLAACSAPAQTPAPEAEKKALLFIEFYSPF